MQTVPQGKACTKLPAFWPELPVCNVFWSSEPTFIKSFWYCISTIGLRLSPIQFEPSLTNQSSSILNNQGSAFWAKLWRFGVLICMKMKQTGSRDWDFSIIYVNFPLAWRTHFLFPPKTENCLSLARAETLKKSHQNRAGRMEQTSVKQSRGVGWSRWNRLEQSWATSTYGHLTPWSPHPRSVYPQGHFKAMLLHSHAS